MGNDYRIVRPLSAGGMGQVYVAEQISTGKERALKVMHARLIEDAKQRERFVREAVLASAVESDHVVEIIAAGVEAESSTPWIAMELLEGEDLNRHIRKHRGLGVDDAVTIFRQVCHALGASHDLSIVHRDLKPQNIFMARKRSNETGYTVKLLDFGIAKVVADSTLSTTAALGSPAWMAPEQTETTSNIGPNADVWAIGLLFFYAVTGSYYWVAANSSRGSVEAVMREILLEKIDLGSERAADLGCAKMWPAWLASWLARCLVREPALRFADATAAWEGLERSLERELGGIDSEPDTDREDDYPTTRRTSEIPTPDEPVSHRKPPPVDTTLPSLDEPAEIDLTAQPLASTARPGAPRNRWIVAVAALVVGATGMFALLQARKSEPVPLSDVQPVTTTAPTETLPTPTTRPPVQPPSAQPSVTAASTTTVSTSVPPATTVRARMVATSTAAPPAPKADPKAAPPFDHALARRKLAGAAAQARKACSKLAGPRSFSVTVTYFSRGGIHVASPGGSNAGECVKATMQMARVGAFDSSTSTVDLATQVRLDDPYDYQ